MTLKKILQAEIEIAKRCVRTPINGYVTLSDFVLKEGHPFPVKGDRRLRMTLTVVDPWGSGHFIFLLTCVNVSV